MRRPVAAAGRRGGAGRAVGHRAVDQGRPVRLPAGDAEGGGRRRSSGRLQRCRGLCAGHRQRPVPDPPLGRRCGRAHRHAAALEERRHARAVRRPRLALRLLGADRRRRLLHLGQRAPGRLGPLRDRQRGLCAGAAPCGAHVLSPAPEPREGRTLRGRTLGGRRRLRAPGPGPLGHQPLGQGPGRDRARSLRRLDGCRRHQQVRDLRAVGGAAAARCLPHEPGGVPRRLRHPRVRQRPARPARRAEVGAGLPAPHAGRQRHARPVPEGRRRQLHRHLAAERRCAPALLPARMHLGDTGRRGDVRRGPCRLSRLCLAGGGRGRSAGARRGRLGPREAHHQRLHRLPDRLRRRRHQGRRRRCRRAGPARVLGAGGHRAV